MEPIGIGSMKRTASEALNKHSIDALVMRARSVAGKQFELIDDRETGLRIRAGERSATWMLGTRLANGKRSRIKLGVWPSMGISDARKAAQAKKLEVAQGIDPNETKREAVRQAAQAAARRRTVRNVLDQYQAMKLSQLRHGDAVRRALDGNSGILRSLADRDIASIVRADVAEPIRNHAIKAPMAANRGLAYAKAFFNWCVVEEIIDASPAATIKKPAKENERDRRHSIAELREIWFAASSLGYPFGPLYHLLITIPMRREELAAMTLNELDLGDDDNPGGAVWTLPSARTKNGHALRVALSPLARSIINNVLADPARPPSSIYVFSMTSDTPVSGFTKAKRRLDKTIASNRRAAEREAGTEQSDMPHWTVHDLRTTFTTLACDKLKINQAVADRILNHVATATTSKISRIYNKSEIFEDRAEALCAWAALLERECMA
jgi:integrase